MSTTWSQESGMAVTYDQDNLQDVLEQAEGHANDAAESAELAQTASGEAISAASQIGDSVTAAANSATAAAASAVAAQTAEAGTTTAVSDSAASAAQAATSATAASTSATSAANSATAAANSATTAANSVSDVAADVAAADASATAAANSATAAASSATAAANYAASIDPDNLYTKTDLDGGQLDNRYYTESEVDTALTAKADLDSSPTFTGTVTATSYQGDGSQLTNIEGVTAAALIKYGAM